MMKLPFRIVVLVFSLTVGGWTLAAGMNRNVPIKRHGHECAASIGAVRPHDAYDLRRTGVLWIRCGCVRVLGARRQCGLGRCTVGIADVTRAGLVQALLLRSARVAVAIRNVDEFGGSVQTQS